MPEYRGDYIYATTHDFKTNLSKYMRLLERGRYKGVMVKRYAEVVGIFVAANISDAAVASLKIPD